ncbi:MAG: hypothetical protein PV347_01285 [Rickettsiaceae bacterium]|nr:hypothetical protein [Rickettsiaceae bacterium]MDD9337007.1 hypothetical protein [Rickettsiaceae bacterium]
MTSKRGSFLEYPPQRWDIYNIGYSYREPDLEGGSYILNEIAPILDIIPQITSYQSSNSSYATQNSQKSQEVARKNQEVYQKNQENTQKNREITEVQQKIARLQAQESSLQSQVNSFQIGDTIKALNAKQKAHTLQKIWGASDADSASVINAIKQYGFDPHYIHKNGQSLVQLAISKNDMTLFDLLIANKIDFNDCIADLPNFQLVLTSGNNNFISKMLATGQDFSKSVLNAVLRDDAAMLAKMFDYKADLSQISYSGYSLLQLALKHGSYKAAEQILQSNPKTIEQLGASEISAFSKNPGKIANKILETNPDIVNKLDDQDSSPLYHALLQNNLPIADSLLNQGADSKIVMQRALTENNASMIKDLVALKPESSKVVLDDNKTPLYLALEQDKIEIAKLLLETSDLMSVVRLSADKTQANITVKLIKLQPNLLTKLAQVENSGVAEKLLEDPGFMSLAESLTDSNGNNLLHLACQNNNYQLATRILEKAHINVNQQNSEGKTAFHILLENSLGFEEKSQLAEALLKYHPDIRLSDDSGHTSIDLAVNDPAILTLFFQQNLMGDSSHTDS